MVRFRFAAAAAFLMLRRAAAFCFALAMIAPLVPLEELYRPFVFSGLGQRRKRPQVPALSCLWILLPRIQPVLSGFQFADHACQFSIVL
jgi:hypothetical protein